MKATYPSSTKLPLGGQSTEGPASNITKETKNAHTE